MTLALFLTAYSQDQTSQKDPTNTASRQAPMVKGKNDRDIINNRVIGVTKDDEQQSKQAARMIKEIMKKPDQGIPQNIWDAAECVAAFPAVRRIGSVVGGRGMVSCRTGGGWSAPVYLTMRGDNLGAPTGVEPSDVVMMFMNKDSMNLLQNDKFTAGADEPVIAGPVGRTNPVTAGAPTGAVVNANIVCYTRSKGTLAGAIMDGAVIELDGDDMRDVYGDNFNFKEILEGGKTPTKAKVMAFSETLSRYTSRQARK